MKSSRFKAFRWLLSFALVLFYQQFLEIAPVKLNPALDGVNPSFDFLATAYAVEGITASGLPTSRGVVAADPKVLPLGSIIEVDTPGHAGIYRVADTGPLIRGRRIDIFIQGHQRAAEFGHKRVKVKVLQFGKRGSSPSSSGPAEAKPPGVVHEAQVLVQDPGRRQRGPLVGN